MIRRWPEGIPGGLAKSQISGSMDSFTCGCCGETLLGHWQGGVLFVKESYVVPADVQYEARTTNPLQFSGLKFGVNLRHDKCTVVPNRVHSVANLRNSFFRHADSFPSPDSCATPVDFKLHPTK